MNVRFAWLLFFDEGYFNKITVVNETWAFPLSRSMESVLWQLCFQRAAFNTDISFGQE